MNEVRKKILQKQNPADGSRGFGSPLQEKRIEQNDRKIKYVIFDFGGVFVVEGLKTAMEKYERATGINIKEKWQTIIKPVWRQLEKAEIGQGDFWKAVKELIGDDRFELKEFRRVFAESEKRNEEIVELIKRLRKEGYLTALLTNNVKEWLEDYNQRDSLSQYFDVIVSSHEVKEIKPEPRIYKIALQRLNASPEECLFIDDKERNLETAKNIGMKTVLFQSPGQTVKEVEEILQNQATKKKTEKLVVYVYRIIDGPFKDFFDAYIKYPDGRVFAGPLCGDPVEVVKEVFLWSDYWLPEDQKMNKIFEKLRALIEEPFAATVFEIEAEKKPY